MIYLISRLKGKAYSTIAYGISRDRTVKFASNVAILVLLEQAFADVDECNSAPRKILTLKQGQKATSTHISDWFEVAQKTELSNNALINHLYDSLHPATASHIQNRIMLRIALSTDLTSYLVEVRYIDAVLRSTNPTHTKGKSTLNTYQPTVQPVISPDSPPMEDAMDLSASKIGPSVTWTAVHAANRRIPRNDAARQVKRTYCFKNKLCSWCYDPSHRAWSCAEARWNHGKTVIEAEKA
ncbi:hypothetical protein K3495_g996 [Podosphaera aphanis]|nr:hypothetical protein K3495_g996 [Podosphaera aphanis]